jgi:hypothetical protein
LATQLKLLCRMTILRIAQISENESATRQHRFPFRRRILRKNLRKFARSEFAMRFK